MIFNIFINSSVWVSILISLIYFFIFFLVRRRAEAKVSESIRDFIWFDFWFAVFFGTLGIVSLIFQESAIGLTFGYIFVHTFLFIGLAYLARLSYRLSWIRFANHAFVFILIFGAAMTLLSIFFPNQNPHFELHRGIGHIHWNINPLVGRLYLISTFLFFLAILRLVYKSFKLRGRTLIRFSLLIAGIIIMNIFGPLHDLAKTTSQFFLADWATFFGHILVLISVLYRASFSSMPPPGGETSTSGSRVS